MLSNKSLKDKLSEISMQNYAMPLLENDWSDQSLKVL